MFLCAPDDNPHDIANRKRSLQAVRKAGGAVVPPRTETEEVYLSTKYDLDAEQRALGPAEIRSSATEVVKRGTRRTVSWVNCRDLPVPSVTREFPCEGIEQRDPVTMTPGGSVYVQTVHFRDGEALSLVAAASRPDAREKRFAKKHMLEDAAGTSKTIRAKNLQYHREFFTIDGVRNGWSAFDYRVVIGSQE